jgi:Holliday junction resolvase RusA-like endonuclease
VASVKFVVLGTPTPKARPRAFYAKATGRLRVVTPTTTRKYERKVGGCAWLALVLSKQVGTWPQKAERYVVELDIFLPDARTRDSDNVVKAIIDGATGALWADDRWTMPRVNTLEIDRENPRVEVTVHALV